MVWVGNLEQEAFHFDSESRPIGWNVKDNGDLRRFPGRKALDKIERASSFDVGNHARQRICARIVNGSLATVRGDEDDIGL